MNLLYNTVLCCTSRWNFCFCWRLYLGSEDIVQRSADVLVHMWPTVLLWRSWKYQLTGILFVSILCKCCSHFSRCCFTSFTIFCAPVSSPIIHSFLYLVLLFKLRDSNISSVSLLSFLQYTNSLPNCNTSLGVIFSILNVVSLFIYFLKQIWTLYNCVGWKQHFVRVDLGTETKIIVIVLVIEVFNYSGRISPTYFISSYVSIRL